MRFEGSCRNPSGCLRWRFCWIRCRVLGKGVGGFFGGLVTLSEGMPWQTSRFAVGWSMSRRDAHAGRRRVGYGEPMVVHRRVLSYGKRRLIGLRAISAVLIAYGALSLEIRISLQKRVLLLTRSLVMRSFENNPVRGVLVQHETAICRVFSHGGGRLRV